MMDINQINLTRFKSKIYENLIQRGGDPSMLSMSLIQFDGYYHLHTTHPIQITHTYNNTSINWINIATNDQIDYIAQLILD